MSDKQDKEFDPTPRRLQKARDEGNVFKSQEASTVGMLLAGLSVLFVGMPTGFGSLERLAGDLFLRSAATELTVSSAAQVLQEVSFRTGLIVLPLLGVLMVTAVFVTVLQTGPVFTAKPLAPKLNRISPLQGFKRIFSARGLFTTLKSVLKIVVLGSIAYVTIKGFLPEALMLHTRSLPAVLSTAGGWLLVLLSRLFMVVLILSGIDFGFEKWRYKEDLKMSKQELKDESKESEGDAQVKGRRRAFARELLSKPRLDHAVLKADVVVTNPTHYAVALRYDPAEGAAPRVLVKGIRKRALRIKELAREHGIPTVEDRPLARALYAAVDESQEIPSDLYAAVAALLAEIYKARRGGPGGRRP